MIRGRDCSTRDRAGSYLCSDHHTEEGEGVSCWKSTRMLRVSQSETQSASLEEDCGVRHTLLERCAGPVIWNLMVRRDSLAFHTSYSKCDCKINHQSNFKTFVHDGKLKKKKKKPKGHTQHNYRKIVSVLPWIGCQKNGHAYFWV